MRYRIYFKDDSQTPAEVDCYDLRVIGSRRLKAFLCDAKHGEDCVTLYYGSEIKRIADNHDRTVFEA